MKNWYGFEYQEQKIRDFIKQNKNYLNYSNMKVKNPACKNPKNKKYAFC